MKKTQKQTEDKKKKRKIILLATLIPTGAAVVATAITLPLVLNKNSGKVYTNVTEEEWVAAFTKMDYMHNTNANVTISYKSSMVDPEEPEPHTAESQMFICNKQFKRVDDDGTKFGQIKNSICFPLRKVNGKYRYYTETEEPLLPTNEWIVILKGEYNNTTFDSSTGIYSGSITTSYGETEYQISFNSDKQLDILKTTNDFGEGRTLNGEFKFTNIDSTTIGDYPTDVVDNFVKSTLTQEEPPVHTSDTISSMGIDEEYIFEFDMNHSVATTNTFSIASDSSVVTKDTISVTKAFIMQPDHLIANAPNNITWRSDNTSFLLNVDTLHEDVLYICLKCNTSASNVQILIQGEE